eukprot:2147315-Amphidinium_carterae.2
METSSDVLRCICAKKNMCVEEVIAFIVTNRLSWTVMSAMLQLVKPVRSFHGLAMTASKTHASTRVMRIAHAMGGWNDHLRKVAELTKSVEELRRMRLLLPDDIATASDLDPLVLSYCVYCTFVQYSAPYCFVSLLDGSGAEARLQKYQPYPTPQFVLRFCPCGKLFRALSVWTALTNRRVERFYEEDLGRRGSHCIAYTGEPMRNKIQSISCDMEPHAQIVSVVSPSFETDRNNKTFGRKRTELSRWLTEDPVFQNTRRELPNLERQKLRTPKTSKPSCCTYLGAVDYVRDLVWPELDSDLVPGHGAAQLDTSVSPQPGPQAERLNWRCGLSPGCRPKSMRIPYGVCNRKPIATTGDS